VRQADPKDSAATVHVVRITTCIFITFSFYRYFSMSACDAVSGRKAVVRGFRRSNQRLYYTHRPRQIGHDLVTLSPIGAESKNTNETLSVDYHFCSRPINCIWNHGHRFYNVHNTRVCVSLFRGGVFRFDVFHYFLRLFLHFLLYACTTFAIHYYNNIRYRLSSAETQQTTYYGEY